jgi:sugar O-acyltransferase (sialic acid O-acetyltransferase NeuD family)
LATGVFINLVIIGAGGHAKVVTEAAQLSGWQVVGVLDDTFGKTIYDFPYLGTVSDVKTLQDTHYIIAIGANQAREKIKIQLENRVKWAMVIHPRAIVSPKVKIGVGTVIFAGAIVQPDTIIGEHVILNTGSQVDHDNKIGDFAHVAPNAVLTGGVELDEGVFVGAGAIVTPGVKLGKWCTLGAGAVAVRGEYLENQIYVGNPARKLFKP